MSGKFSTDILDAVVVVVAAVVVVVVGGVISDFEREDLDMEDRLIRNVVVSDWRRRSNLGRKWSGRSRFVDVVVVHGVVAVVVVVGDVRHRCGLKLQRTQTIQKKKKKKENDEKQV